MKFFGLVIIFICLISCAGTPPFLEYTIAQKALKSARKVNSNTNADVHWKKALHYYYKAEKRFRDRDYISPRQFFNESIKWAEKAENFSRFKMSTGDGM